MSSIVLYKRSVPCVGQKLRPVASTATIPAKVRETYVCEGAESVGDVKYSGYTHDANH